METIQTLFDDTYTGPRWTYGLRNRPLSIGAQPLGWIIYSLKGEGGRFRFGTIDYPRELTPEEVSDYDLAVVPKARGEAEAGQWTPLPWTLETDSQGLAVNIRCSPDEHDSGTYITAIESSRGQGETLANARLMAAAPELAKALRMVLECPAMNDDAAEPETVRAYDCAMAALAKAEGR